MKFTSHDVRKIESMKGDFILKVVYGVSSRGFNFIVVRIKDFSSPEENKYLSNALYIMKEKCKGSREKMDFIVEKLMWMNNTTEAKVCGKNQKYFFLKNLKFQTGKKLLKYYCRVLGELLVETGNMERYDYESIEDYDMLTTYCIMNKYFNEIKI